MVKVLDNLTVWIGFDAPTPYPYAAFVGTGTPIISRAQFAECVGEAAESCKEQNTAPPGTGPYRITGFKANEEAVYERNSYALPVAEAPTDRYGQTCNRTGLRR